MSKYDPDRIAALAAGSLDPAEAAAFEAEIAADPRATAELAAQRLALGAIRRSPAPVLSADERAELRRAVAAALHLEESPRSPPPPPPPAGGCPGGPWPWPPPPWPPWWPRSRCSACSPSAATNPPGPPRPSRPPPRLPGDAAIAEPRPGVQPDRPATPPRRPPPWAAPSPTRRPARPGPSARPKRRWPTSLPTPALLFGPAPADPIPCLDEAESCSRRPTRAGRSSPWSGARWRYGSCPTTGPPRDRLVALDPITCEFLAAYP